MSLELTGVEPGELEEFMVAGELPFGYRPEQSDLDHWAKLLEPGRAFAVRDDGQIVATCANLSMDVSVPGGARVPMAGVTFVGVWPSHRRRGLAGRLLARAHADARERGEPLAGLWASESRIYGRFGYGCAARMVRLEIATADAAFRSPLDARGRVRLVDIDEAGALLADLHERERDRRGGMPVRRLEHVRAMLAHDPEHQRDGAGIRFFAAVADRGLAVYRVAQHWGATGPANTVRVQELYADDGEAHALLWRYLLDLDLVRRLEAQGRPVDDVLPHLLADPRRLEATVIDALWLRLLDVAAVLEARRYALDGALTVEVVDDGAGGVVGGDAGGGVGGAVGGDAEPGEAGGARPAGPRGPAAGRFRLAVDGGTASCRPTGASADVLLPAASLAAACLGDVRLTALARAGRASEHTAGALRRLDLMLSSDPLPWCPFEF